MPFVFPSDSFSRVTKNLRRLPSTHRPPALAVCEQRASTKEDQGPPSRTFSAPGRYPEYFLANEDFLSTKSSQTMDYDMESKVNLKTLPSLQRGDSWRSGGGGWQESYVRWHRIDQTDVVVSALFFVDGCLSSSGSRSLRIVGGISLFDATTPLTSLDRHLRL